MRYLDSLVDNQDNQFDWQPYVSRGALGGAIGNVAVVLIGAGYVWTRFHGSTLPNLLIAGATLGLVAGALLGGAVGFVIWKLRCKFGRQPSWLLRILTGLVCLLVFSLVKYFGSNRYNLVFELMYASLVGGVAGLLARARPSQNEAASCETRA